MLFSYFNTDWSKDANHIRGVAQHPAKKGMQHTSWNTVMTKVSSQWAILLFCHLVWTCTMIKMEILTFWGKQKKLDFLFLWYLATGLCAYPPIFLTLITLEYMDQFLPPRLAWGIGSYRSYWFSKNWWSGMRDTVSAPIEEKFGRSFLPYHLLAIRVPTWCQGKGMGKQNERKK